LFFLIVFSSSVFAPGGGGDSSSVTRTATTETTCNLVPETKIIHYTDYCVDYDSFFNETSGEEETYCKDMRENYERTNTIYRESCTMYEEKTPINYFDGNSFVPIETDILVSDGTKGNHEMTKSSYNTYFQDNIQDGKGIRFEKDGYFFTYDLSGGKIQWAEQEGDSTKTKSVGAILSSVPYVDGNKIRYNNSFLNTDVEYTLKNTMLKEILILNELPTYQTGYLYLEYTGEVQFSNELTIWVEGINYTDKTFKTDERINFRDSDGNYVFHLSKPIAYDSNISSTNLFYDVKVSDTKIGFSLKVPYEFLINSSTVYPVYIDPTIQVYQEDANETACSGSWDGTQTCALTYDGDWGTYGSVYHDASSEYYAYLLVNYTKLSGVNSSKWRIYDGITDTNYSIPTICWNLDDKLVFNVTLYSNPISYHSYYYCFNSSDEWTLIHDNTVGTLYEEAMWWGYDTENIIISDCTTLNIENGYFT